MKNELVMSKALTEILMAATPEQNVHMVHKILHNKNYTAAERLDATHEYLTIALGKSGVVMPAVEAKPQIEVKKPKKHNRVPFETKMSMIEYYLNNDVSMSETAKKFGVNKGTGINIIRTYRKSHPEMFAHK